jgi:hypothetical protein
MEPEVALTELKPMRIFSCAEADRIPAIWPKRVSKPTTAKQRLK